MKRRPCTIAFEDLLLWRDGEMPPLRHALLGRHIAACARCREEIAMMNQIAEELRQDEADLPQPMPAPLRERILSALPAEATIPAAASASTSKSDVAPTTQANKIKPRSRWVEMGAAAGAGALALLVVMSISGQRVSSSFDASTDGLSTSESYDSSGDASTASGSASGASAGAASSASAGDAKQLSQQLSQRRALSNVQQFQMDGNGNGATFSSGNVLYADGHVRAARGSFAAGVAGAASYANSLRSADEASGLLSSERQVHRDASIGVGVGDVEESAASVESLAKGVGGFVATTEVSTGSNGLRSASLSLRVPVKKFEDVMSQVARMGRLLSKSVSGEDITARLSGEARRRQVLATELNAQETVLKAALTRQDAARRRAEDAGRSKTAFEVPWEDRERVRNLRTKTAQSRAQLEALRQAAEMSDIEVELKEKRVVPGQAGFSQEMRQTMHLALSSFAVALRAPFSTLIWILAYAPLWLPALLLCRFAMKRRDQAASQAASAPSAATIQTAAE